MTRLEIAEAGQEILQMDYARTGVWRAVRGAHAGVVKVRRAAGDSWFSRSLERDRFDTKRYASIALGLVPESS